MDAPQCRDLQPNAAMSGEPKASPLDGTVMHQTEKKDD